MNQGYRHIDTAKVYQNEEAIGEALEECMAAGIRREELFITTKLWHDDYHNVEAACRESLRKLRLEYVDLYLIHWPVNGMSCSGSPKVPMHVLWAKMEQLKELGLARAIGVSNFNIFL